ncbi:hypothetical protein Tco_0586823 [Tanacetum coccineum]
MELVLEQTQQGTSYEVSVSAKGVEELKRKVKKKGEKKEALLTLRFDTSAGNPVKEILLKLNLPDHRYFKMELKRRSVKVKELQERCIIKAFQVIKSRKLKRTVSLREDIQAIMNITTIKIQRSLLKTPGIRTMKMIMKKHVSWQSDIRRIKSLLKEKQILQDETNKLTIKANELEIKIKATKDIKIKEAYQNHCPLVDSQNVYITKNEVALQSSIVIKPHTYHNNDIDEGKSPLSFDRATH